MQKKKKLRGWLDLMLHIIVSVVAFQQKDCYMWLCFYDNVVCEDVNRQHAHTQGSTLQMLTVCWKKQHIRLLECQERQKGWKGERERERKEECIPKSLACAITIVI